MSFELRQGESIRMGIRRIVRTQLQSAEMALGDSDGESLDERIHAVRKVFKRVRAVLRLVRYAIGRSAYGFENEAFRDAARPLSEIRDAKVLIAALDSLGKNTRRAAARAEFSAARTWLVERERIVHQTVLAEQDAFAVTAKSIEDARERLDDWSDLSRCRRPLLRGVGRQYRDGRNAFDDVKTEPSVERLHEWRKQVKYLRHALEVLSPVNPKVVGRLARQAEELGEILGEDHDLAVLHHTLSGSEYDHPEAGVDAITALVTRKRKTLQREAIDMGEALYRKRPKDLVARLEAYWRKWAKRAAKRRA